MEKETKIKVLKSIMADVDKELDDEEIIHLILDKTVSKDVDKQAKARLTFGDKAADFFAKFAGSWGFIIGFTIGLVIWFLVNIKMSNRAFDPYPFILLNLVLSCLAAIQAPIIMMSQNRQEKKDRERAENDYKVNLKTEIIIQDLHQKLDEILKNQETLQKANEENKRS